MNTDETAAFSLLSELQRAATDARFFEVLGGLREMGSRAAVVATDLLPFLSDTNRRYEVRRTLAAMGPAIRGIVEHHLAGGHDEHELIFACYVLADVGTPVSALPTLSTLFVTGSENMMYAAGKAICAAGAPALGEFSRILRGSHTELSAREAARSLGEVTGTQKCRDQSLELLALQALEDALGEDAVRSDAADAIAAIAARVPQLVSASLLDRAKKIHDAE